MSKGACRSYTAPYESSAQRLDLKERPGSLVRASAREFCAYDPVRTSCFDAPSFSESLVAVPV